MQRSAPLSVRYNRVVALGSIALGLVCLLLGVWVTLLGHTNPSTVVGLIPLLTGALMLGRPYFVVEPGRIRVRAMIGTRDRELPFHSLDVRRGRLTALSATGERTRVPVSRWLAHHTDWAVLATSPPIGSDQRPDG